MKPIVPKPEWTGPNQPFVLVDKLKAKPSSSKAANQSAIVQESPPRQTRTAMMAASPLILPTQGKTPYSMIKPPPAELSPKITPKPAILGRPRITPVPLSRLTKPPPQPAAKPQSAAKPQPPAKPQPRGRGRPRLHPLPSLAPVPPRPVPPRPVFKAPPVSETKLGNVPIQLFRLGERGGL